MSSLNGHRVTMVELIINQFRILIDPIDFALIGMHDGSWDDSRFMIKVDHTIYSGDISQAGDRGLIKVNMHNPRKRV